MIETDNTSRRCASALLALGFAICVPFLGVGAQKLYSVGASDSPSGIDLAEVTAATTLAGERLVILDGKDKALYLVSRDGKRFKKSGREGSGPGEFRSPTRLAIDASGAVIVFDPPLRRFSWFKDAGDSLLFVRSASITDNVRDFCVMSNRLYTITRNGRPISAYKITPTELVLSDSMGASNLRHPLASHPMVRGFGQAGPVGCNEPAKQVLWHSSQLDAGQVLSLSGQQSPLRLPDFAEVVMTEIENGIKNSLRKDGTAEVVREIIPTAASQYFVVSAVSRGPEAKSEYRVRIASFDGRTSMPTTVRARLHSYKAGIAVCEPISEVPEIFVVRSAPSPNRYPCDNTLLKRPQ